jgi:hypothetical protein
MHNFEYRYGNTVTLTNGGQISTSEQYKSQDTVILAVVITVGKDTITFERGMFHSKNSSLLSQIKELYKLDTQLSKFVYPFQGDTTDYFKLKMLRLASLLKGELTMYERTVINPEPEFTILIDKAKLAQAIIDLKNNRTNFLPQSRL